MAGRGVALFSRGSADPAGGRRTLPLVYTLLFLNTLQFIGMVSVAPTYADQLDLSKFQTSLIFAVSGAATAVAAIPIGLFCDRIGARPVALTGATIVAVTLILQGYAPGLGWLLVARVFIGVGFSAVLCAGPTWAIDTSPPDKQARAAALLMPVAGMGLLVGPYLAGALSDAFGRGVPMVVFSILLAGVIAALLASPPGGTEPHGHDPVLKTLKRGRGSILVVAALLLFGTGVLGETASAVLGPLRLDHNGLSASEIGAIFSGGAALLVAVSLVMMRHEKKMLRMPVATFTMLALTLVLVLLAATSSTVPIAVALVLRTAILGAIYTVAFPFAAMGAEEAGIGLGAVYATMQLVAGTSNAIGPLAAGKIGEAFGDATAYGICAALSGAAAVWLFMAGRRIRANGGSTAPSATGGRV